jgi:predicted ATPase/DNA-binding SARP family transcriptional activator/Tfp pilus assembly protein PilF
MWHNPGTATGRSSMELAPLSIHLFGPLEVRVHGAAMRSGRTRSVEWLLALLVLRQGGEVSRSALAGTFWPESSPEQALLNLRRNLMDLRQALGAEAERLRSPNRDTLRLDLTDASVDLLRFDAAVAAGDENSLHEAVVLYRGPLLEGCSEAWIFGEREARREACLQALERLADLALAHGEATAALGHLLRAETLDPLRDSVQQRRMQTLAESGDLPAALLSFRDFRLRLHREMKLEPDPETTRLYRELLAGRHRRGPGLPDPTRPAPPVTSASASTPSRAHSLPLSRIPRPLTTLIGREEELDEVTRLVAASRLVTLIGGGGVGKTRLALQVASAFTEEYPGRRAFVELAPLAEPVLLPGFVAAALGLREPAAPDPRDPMEPLIDCLSEQPTLLVLDNCEHLIEVAAELTQSLLTACPELCILATSRQRLGLTGEVAWRVPSLPGPDPEQFPADAPGAMEYALRFPAAQLLVERAAAVRSGFRLRDREDALAVARICQRLDGIPLALELAAARTMVLDLTQIAARLDDRFRLLTGGSRAALPRHRTLRALIDWSYDLLTDDERTLLRRFSVFVAGWTLEAAEAICGDQGAGCWVLGAAYRTTEPDARYSEPAGPVPAPSTQHPPPDVVDLLASLTDKSLVLVGEDAAGLRYRMLETIREYAAERLRESGEEEAARNAHLACFFRLAQEAGPSLRGPAAEAAFARLNTEIGNLRAALAWAQTEAAPLEVCARFVAALWPYWQRHGSLFEGCSLVQAALDRCAGHESPERAELLLGAAELADEFQNRQAQLAARSLPVLGDPTLWASDHERATADLEQALAIQRRLGQRPDMVVTLRCLGLVAQQQGDRARALAYLQEAVAIARELGNRLYLSLTVHEWGCVLYHHGAYEEARALLTEALTLFRQPGGEYAISFGCNNLGMALSRLGDHAGASELHREALAHYLRKEHRDGKKDWDGIVWSLRDLALSGMREAEAEKAARLLGTASKLREEPECLINYWDESIAAVRAVLGEEAFRRAFEAGRALSGEQAVMQALEGA